MASQSSFSSVIGRFQNAVSLLIRVPAYNPTNALITLNNLNQFISEVINQNRIVDSAAALLGAKREARKQLAYKISRQDNDCLERRLRAVIYYLKGDLPTENAAIRQIHGILKQIKPVYARKNSVNQTQLIASKSPSEKSFSALVGNARVIIALLETLHTYKPINPKIDIDELKALTNKLEQLNIETTMLYENYSKSIIERKELYFGKTGLAVRRILIRNILASFEGGKQNQHYKEFSSALREV